MPKDRNKDISLSCCNKRHKPVWFYDDHSCPVCAAKMLIEEYEIDLQEMREQLLELETELERAKNNIEG